MFRWDFAKSAEAMLSRWAIKRVCKFLLKKKKLGDYIDLDQLDVQLAEGAIQLRDLALNVDFINEKMGEAPVFVKEGTIVSLSIRIPWRMKNCQIEVEDLELVIAPRGDNRLPTDTDICLLNGGEKDSQSNATGKLEQGVGPGSSPSTSLDVHEGVKTIAKIVKWFLTSFNVKLRNLIVAFDPCPNRVEKGSSTHRNLVLRIAEIEFGTCVSEDTNAKLNSLLGIAKLTNFIKFQGAVVEFLEMCDACASETSFGELYSKSSPSGSTFPVLTGSGDGFTGILNLSIPWKNGSLDIRKVDADISIDPVELLLQPRTIKWIIFSWESLKHVDKDGRSHVSSCNADNVQSCSSGTVHPDNTRKIASKGIFSMDTDSQMIQGSRTGDSSSPSYIIQNWVTSDNSLRGHAELEADYGASIDQFFECFDEMRSSQASLSNSGIFNWTYSVFSAITAASSLASESGYIPYEKQYSETNLKAKVSAVSVVLSFDDELSCSQHLMDGYRHMGDLYRTVYDTFPTTSSHTVQYIETKFQDLVLTLQICPNRTEVEATISHIKVNDSLKVGNEAGKLFSIVSHLQAVVLDALPPWPFAKREFDAKSTHFPPHTPPWNESFIERQCSTISKEGLVKVQLLESFGACCCKYSLSSTNLNNKSTMSSSFSIYLPQLILWLDFSLVKMLVTLFEQVVDSLEDCKVKDLLSDISEDKHDNSSRDVCNGTGIPTISPSGSLRGDVFLPNTRIILCFPSDNIGDIAELFCWSSFIGLEFSSLSSGADKAAATVQVPKPVYLKGHSHTSSSFVHFHNGPLDAYLITSRKDVLGDQSTMDDRPNFVSKKILSTGGGIDYRHSLITMVWQKGPVTGPWMAERAWGLATLQDPRNRRNISGKGNEFVSVKTAGDLEEMNSQVRQEMVLSSAFLMHISLPRVWINLSSHEYRLLYFLLNEVKDALSCLHRDKDGTTVDGLRKEKSLEIDHNATQASVLVECDLLDIEIALDEVLEISPSLQKELPGWWNSLKLKIQNFELLSVSSVGGISGDNFFWLSHDEGDLLGSIINMDDAASASTHDILLITCRNSTMKRGDGDGGNILNSGSAGTSVTHLSNQQLFQSFTSINVRCATIIAPGGRLDWFGAIFLYFSLPSGEGTSETNSMGNELSEGVAAHKQLFVLDLMDVALSYEPHLKSSGLSSVVPVECHSSAKLNDESAEQNVACLLAAASLNLFNEATGNAAARDYNIRLQDIGLHICEQFAPKTEIGTYSVNNLQETGYAKVAKEALVDAILRTNCQNGLLWEVELSDSHVSMGTCHDTTSGLVRLVAQLQLLFAPDVEDALVHLQSRWDSFKQTHNENDATSEAKMHSSSVGLASYEGPSKNDENSAYTGLMDEILDNAFCWKEKQTLQVDSCDIQSDVLFHRSMRRVRYNLDISSPAAGDLSLPNVSFDGSILRSGLENSQISTAPNMCMPQLIERYYTSDLLSQPNPSGSSSTEESRNGINIAANRDVECGKGGWYTDTPLMIVDDHISDRCDNTGGQQANQENKLPFVTTAPVETCMARGRVLLRNIDVRWRMYSGRDWQKAQRYSMPGSDSDSTGRDQNACLELILSGLNLQYDFYPDAELFVSKLSLSVQDFHLYDRSRNAPWKMVLGYYHSKDHPRESSAKAFKLDLESVKPDPSTPLEEYRLHFSFLPMRLHLHQGQLDFLLSFFSNDASVGLSSGSTNDLVATQTSVRKNTSVEAHDIAEEALLPFFQKCDIYPSVVCVDYIPHHVDMAALRGGNYAQLINLVPWKGIDIQLMPVHAVGVYGWGSVCETVVGEWLEDISQNQVHKILKGLTPVRSLFAVSSGAAKLVSLPVKTYKKDHRLLKGIQRGAIAFLRSVSLEAVGLGVHLASGAHDLLIQTEHILTRIPPSVPLSQGSLKASVRCNQPKNARHGIQQAYESLSDGFGKTASALVGTPLKTYQRGAGAGSALASAIRAAPVAAVAPASAVARALHCTLLGVRNSLDPEHKKESMEKYLGSSIS
uniref:Autophagy-related protein 2 n=1 Tax=Anthurium amnicola TaxID=1678845 RepID=A0A1D1XDD5_9ARAE